MSNIDKLIEKLKSAALKLNREQWQTRNGFSGVEVIVKDSVAKGYGCVSYQPVASELVDTKTAKAIALFCPANILALLDELEAAEERYEDMLRQARSFREAHDSASEIIRKLERNKPVVKLPTTKLWAGKVACYEASEIIELLSAAGIRIQGED